MFLTCVARRRNSGPSPWAGSNQLRALPWLVQVCFRFPIDARRRRVDLLEHQLRVLARSAQGLRSDRENADWLAGAPGFEPGITGPKPHRRSPGWREAVARFQNDARQQTSTECVRPGRPRARAVSVLVGSPALFEPECRTPRQMQLASADGPMHLRWHPNGRSSVRPKS